MARPHLSIICKIEMCSSSSLCSGWTVEERITRDLLCSSISSQVKLLLHSCCLTLNLLCQSNTFVMCINWTFNFLFCIWMYVLLHILNTAKFYFVKCWHWKVWLCCFSFFLFKMQRHLQNLFILSVQILFMMHILFVCLFECSYECTYLCA